MDQIISLIPKWLLATIVIGAGIAGFVIYDPPHTICESQIEVFHASQRRFLFLDPKRKAIVTSKYTELANQCKFTNNPGGCYELFQEMRMLLKDLEAVPSDCMSRVGSITEVRKALQEVVTLLVRLAWGEKPPATYHEKFGWLDSADISLYCKLKQVVSDTYTTEWFEDFREKMFKELPGADKMSRTDVWDMTLFSENCARYP